MSSESVTQPNKTLSRHSTKHVFIERGQFSGNNFKCSESGARVQSIQTCSMNVVYYSLISTIQRKTNADYL